MSASAFSIQARKRPAALAEIESALAGLDGEAGIYFGCDAGVAGLHPLQATLMTRPALAFKLHEDGTTVHAMNAFGKALLRHEALAPCLGLAGRGVTHAAEHGARASAIAVVRAFQAACGGAPEAVLLGAFGFECHRLASGTPSMATAAGSAPLGVLFFADSYWQRDGSGDWQHVALEVQGLPEQGDDASPVSPHEAGAAPMRVPASSEPQDDFLPGGYAEVVARAVQVLQAQPLVSLTLSQSFRRRVATPPSAAFARLRQVNPAPATFFVNTGEGECLFGASPDLQLAVRGREIESFPVCGTVARGAGAVGEAESFRELVNEEVDAASLAVCSDALGNDLAPLCEPGSLLLRDRRRPMSLSTVVHTVDRLQGRLREGVDAWDAILATAAPVMLTGTPRALALAAIASLEASARGWYGGMVVRVDGKGDALDGTILRAAAIRDGVAEVRTGGDLMADSDPPREERESRLKAVSLWRALGLPVESAVAAEHAGNVGANGAELAPRLSIAVALHDGADPFPATVAQVLRGFGVALQDAAAVRVLIGAEAASDRVQHMVALGDAAARVLGSNGFAIERIQPEHGRLLRCHVTPQAPWQGARSFLAARYATLGLRRADGVLPPGWQAWAHDDEGCPVALAHAPTRCVCLLFRPDSLLADDTARTVLRFGLAFAANAGA